MSKGILDGLERCGYCGRFVRDGVDVDAEDILKKLTEEEINALPLGYCRDAMLESGEYTL